MPLDQMSAQARLPPSPHKMKGQLLLSKWSAETKTFAGGVTAVAALAGLVGCAMHEGGGQRMQIEAMRENPMHQMMQEMSPTCSR
jgi:hypothetical protein